MTYKTINEINFLASAGVGYQRIAEQLGLSANTVKSHLQRHPPSIDKMVCENCGKPVPQNPGRKMKRYCDDKYRMAYWNSHKDQVKMQAFYTLTCKHCGKEFVSYGNVNRKYCSRVCYGNARKRRT